MLTKPATCGGCALEHSGAGFMGSTGTGANGVLLVGEALGAQEAEQGKPFVGPAGFTLDKLLQRGELVRDDFKIANCLWCQPPFNKLSGAWYMDDALNHCAQYLDKVITEMRPKCIVALGAVAAKRLNPDLKRGIQECRGYVFWSDKYQTHIINTIHPAFILRGQTAWAQVLLYDIQRAVEVARDGFEFVKTDYTLDCTPLDAQKWIEEFEIYYREHSDLYLSCDIETPDKDLDEDSLDLEDRTDYVILRCGYSYKEGHALSIPWDGPFRSIHERLLNHGCDKVVWNGSFDCPRIRSTGIEINGTIHDAMEAFHILNSDLKKSLGFVAPFFAKNYPMWKHLSSAQPAFYNACDADIAGINMRGTVELLRKNDLWKIYEEFILELDPVYSAMSRAGMPVDLHSRIASSKSLIERRNKVRAEFQQIVPAAIKPIQPKDGYKKTPKVTDGLTLLTFNGVTKQVCSNCGIDSPKKAHFKSKLKKFCGCCDAKWTEKHPTSKKADKGCLSATFHEVEQNHCHNATTITVDVGGEQRWAKVLDFIPSTKGVLTYQKAMGHPLVIVGKGDDKKATTDDKAIRNLIGKYPKDSFYKLVLEDREYTKLLGTYLGKWDEESKTIEGGFPVGRDGRIHPHFRHTPSTLRSSCVSPNLQNIPRGNDSDVQKLVKQMFVAAPGHTFAARDFSGIEAVLVGYHAGDKDYIRLAKSDVHSFFLAYNLYKQGILTAADLPDLKWSDSDLVGALHQIKKRFKVERDVAKRCVHAGNYRVGGRKLHEEYPEWFPKVKDAIQVLGFYYELFPSINNWHQRICLQVDKSAVIKNSFGHAHRFYQVLSWKKVGTKWEWSYSDDSKRLIAFGPQSDAALIGKRALKRCYYNYPESMAKWLRLFVHDEILIECPKTRADEADSILQFEMEKPVPELPLPASWNMGSHLFIGSEGKRGDSWWSMA